MKYLQYIVILSLFLHFLYVLFPNYSVGNILIKNWNIFNKEIAYNNKKETQMKTRIKELRQEKNLTQQTLAKSLGINQTTLSKIENESAIPDAMLLISLSNFFHVSTDYILYLSEERLSADSLLADNMHHLKKYQHLISLYRKMTSKQQNAFDSFFCSILDGE